MEWKLEDYRDIDTVLVFAILVINKRSNLVKWNEQKRQDWTAVGGNCPVGGLFWTDEKKEKWKDIEEYEEYEWKIEFYHVSVGCRTFSEGGIVSLLGRHFGYSKKRIKEISAELQESFEKVLLIIWLEIDVNIWLEH